MSEQAPTKLDLSTTQALLDVVIDISEEFKAVDLRALKVTDICSFTDYFVVMTGTSTTHIKSITEEIMMRCKKNGRKPSDIEGVSAAEWTLLDFGDVIVHVFSSEKRAFYNLEELWAEAEQAYPPADAEPA
ncbi:ribosome silencing factor [Acanthopleuribacter pedis]|uniref:Ribosomal silencing factor RsfS n=1 Tax=Acanthopleuribacter pedis TaxID=442870 RepID=A0A8J7Q6M7_9BACT|nr:ribosome silencing factor [Acanthopleuribacter pedis]MBO1319141.1 ribosome silencing factor [Acanthopleuribacter pedis]